MINYVVQMNMCYINHKADCAVAIYREKVLNSRFAKKSIFQLGQASACEFDERKKVT